MIFAKDEGHFDYPSYVFRTHDNYTCVIIGSFTSWYTGKLYVQGFNEEGNLRWPLDPYDHEVTAGGLPSSPVASCDIHGNIWVAFEERALVEPHPWEVGNCQLVLQYVTPDGYGQWNENGDGWPGVVFSETHNPYDQEKRIVHLQALPDTTAIVLWYDEDVEEVNYSGNYWAQRFDADGNELWEPGGIALLPDSLTEGAYRFWPVKMSYNALEADSNHVVFVLGNSVVRLRPDGSFAWPYGEIVIDSMSESNDAKLLTSDRSNNILIVGTHHLSIDSSWISRISQNGYFPDGPGVCINAYASGYISDSFNFGPIGSSNYAIIKGGILILLSESLDPILPNNWRWLDVHAPYHIEMDEHWIRINGEGGYGYLMQFFDTNGDSAFTTYLYDDSTGYGMTDFCVDSLGNTWVVWMRNNGIEQGLDLYANVIDREGNWGQYTVSSPEPVHTSNLPDQLILTAFPNPFNPAVSIGYDLNKTQQVKLVVYDLLGRQVRVLREGVFPAGRHRVTWDGLTGAGQEVAAGTYFLRLETEHAGAHVRKVVLVR